MSSLERGAIHVAGVIDIDEARMLIDCGVGFLGFPLVLGYHREDLRAEEAARIVAELRDEATFFLITYLDDADRIAGLCRELGVSMVQLHGAVDLEQVARLRASWPSLRIIKSLIVRGGNDDALMAEMERFSPAVDAFITDTFDAETGATGATGRTHDWNISSAIARRSPKPLILAGGLRPENVASAIEAVEPWGVDVHTGVEGSNGRKDRKRVESFVRAARRAFESSGAP